MIGYIILMIYLAGFTATLVTLIVLNCQESEPVTPYYEVLACSALWLGFIIFCIALRRQGK